MTTEKQAAEVENIIEADDEVEAALFEYRTLKAAEDEAKRQTEAARERLTDLFNDRGADTFTLGGVPAVTRTAVRKTTLDKNILARLAPKALEKALKTSTYYRINLSNRT